jgi:isocitrate dehydrogenase
VVDEDGAELMSHDCEARRHLAHVPGASDLPIQDWVKLAVTRARLSTRSGVLLARRGRAHDAQLIAKVRQYLAKSTTPPASIEIMSPVEATQFSLERIREGKDTISVTGNVLRDYLTDLFPILELGTSAKMLSIVPLLERRRPVRDRCRWVGAQARAAVRRRELPALGLARRVPRARRLARAPRADDRQCQAPRCSPTRSTRPPQASSTTTSRRPARSARSTTAAPLLHRALLGRGAGGADRRTPTLAARFAPVARSCDANEATINAELIAVQGKPGRHRRLLPPDRVKTTAAMRPSATLNAIIDALRGTGTFRPVSEVVFVTVIQGAAECAQLEQRTRSGRWHRELAFPFHPHVTIAHDVTSADLDRAAEELAAYHLDFAVEALWLFELGRDGQWRPQRSFAFGESSSARTPE